MKKASILFLVLALAGTKAYGQSEYKTLSLFIEGNSGNLNADNGAKFENRQGVFDGNEVEMSLGYSQNFAKAPWLSAYGATHLFYSTAWSSTVNGQPLSAPRSGNHSFDGHLRLGLNFASYFDVQFRSSGLMVFWAGYTLKLPREQFFTVSAETEIWAFQGLTRDRTDTAERIVDLFQIKVAYGTAIAKGWSFATDMGFRFQGYGGNSFNRDTGKPFYEEDSPHFGAIDSPKAFGSTFNIRWNNTFAYQYKAFRAWGTIRYNIGRIAWGAGWAQHSVVLLGGMSYAFDFQKNKE